MAAQQFQVVDEPGNIALAAQDFAVGLLHERFVVDDGPQRAEVDGVLFG